MHYGGPHRSRLGADPRKRPTGPCSQRHEGAHFCVICGSGLEAAWRQPGCPLLGEGVGEIWGCPPRRVLQLSETTDQMCTQQHEAGHMHTAMCGNTVLRRGEGNHTRSTRQIKNSVHKRTAYLFQGHVRTKIQVKQKLGSGSGR